MSLPLLESLSLADRSVVGGKAANLGDLASLGLPVPRGFVVPASYGDTFRQGNAMSPPPEVREAILESFEQLGLAAAAVRSSATIEDSATLSFAGVFDSILNVTRSTLIDAVARCWLSADSPRATEYLGRNGLLNSDVRMAVIIQELIVPDVSGVCFTCHPVSGDADTLLIEAGVGFGDVIVSGRVSPDTFEYHWPSRAIVKRVIGDQTLATVLVHGELQQVPLEPEVRSSQKIPDDLVHDVAALCIALQSHYGRPQDVEFAVRMGTVFLLQARPVTTLNRGGV